MPIEIESPESLGYEAIECNLAESSTRDMKFQDINLHLHELVLAYGDHIGKPALRKQIASPYEPIHADNVLLTAGAPEPYLLFTLLYWKKAITSLL